ncbi:MAG: hypothetical protein ACAH83_20510 [Alphaproteobacteria bacterium]
MPVTNQKENGPVPPSLTRTFLRVCKNVVAGVAFYGAIGTGLYSVWNGITFTRSYEGRAEHTFKDGSHQRADGRGFSFTNPFAVADTRKWELQGQTAYFRSGDEEQDTFKADVSFTFVGPQELATYSKVNRSAEQAGDRTLKEIFQKNGWTSYAAVDPATQPQNAAALCDALSQSVTASLDPAIAEQAKVTGCEIKVKVPFKGYTAKT